MKEFVYKIVHKYVKHPNLLEQFGFHPYEEDKTENDIREVVIARPVKISKDSSIFKIAINLIEYCYKQASEEEKASEDFSEYKFDADGHLIIEELSEKTLDSLKSCQLCFYTSGTGAYQLFINGPDNSQYFNSKVLDEAVGAVIVALLANGIIYRKKIR